MIRDAALSKCSMLYRKMQGYKAKMEYYERENKELHDSFEERVSEFRKQMPRSMQELDGKFLASTALLSSLINHT